MIGECFCISPFPPSLSLVSTHPPLLCPLPHPNSTPPPSPSPSPRLRPHLPPSHPLSLYMGRPIVCAASPVIHHRRTWRVASAKKKKSLLHLTGERSAVGVITRRRRRDENTDTCLRAREKSSLPWACAHCPLSCRRRREANKAPVSSCYGSEK